MDRTNEPRVRFDAVRLKTGRTGRGRLLAGAFVLLFAALFMAPTLSHSLRIFFDSDEFPMYFYNVDNAWTLQHVHALNRTFEYPPRNIAADLPGFKYQYGVVYLGYLLNRLPFLSVYQAMLVVLPISMHLMICLILLRTARGISGRSDLNFLIALFVLMFVRDGKYHPFSPLEGFAMLTRVESHIFRLSQFTQLQALSGYLLLTALIHSVYFRKSFWLSRSCFFLIIFFKAAYFPMALAIIGVEVLHEIMKRQRAIYSFDILLMASAILTLKLFVQPEEHYDRFATFQDFTHSGAWIRFKPFGVIDPLLLLKYLLLSLPLLVLRPSLRGFGLGESMRKMLFVLLINFAVFTTAYIDTPNRLQFTNPIGLLIVFMNAAAFAGFRMSGNRTASAILALHLFFFGFSNVIGGLKIAVETAFDPSKGHEYAHNGALGEVLGHLRVSDRQLLATNDLRYPNNNYSRDNRQFQMSGLFGHSFFNAELFNSYIYFHGDADARREEFDIRREVTRRLAEPTGSLKSEAAWLRSLGITHVILHLKHPSIEHSGCNVIKRNRDYVLVAL